MRWARISPLSLCLVIVVSFVSGGGSVESGDSGGSAREKDLTEIRGLFLGDRLIEAEARLLHRLAALDRSGHADGLETAETLDLLVECRLRAGRGGETQTLELARQVVGIRESDGADHADLSTSLVNLARVRFARAHASAAHHHYSRLLAERERTLGSGSPDVTETLITLGRSKADLGDWEGALPILEKALAIQTRTPGADTVPLATTLANLARVHGHLENPDGREVARRCVRVFEAMYTPENPRLALALEDLAWVLQEGGWDTEAEELVDRALGIWHRTHGPENPFTSRTALHAASLRRIRGDVLAARDLYVRYLPMFEQWPDAEPREVASALAGYSDVLDQLGDPVGSARARDRAESISMTDPSFLSPHHVDTEITRARSLARAGDTSGALDVALDAEAVRRQALRLTGHTLPEQLALQVRECGTSPLDVVLSLTAYDLDPAARRRVVDAVIRSRAVVLDELAVRYRTLCELDRPEISDLFDSFARATARAAQAQVKGSLSLPAGSYDHQLNELFRSREEAEAALAARSVVFRKDLMRSRAGLAEVIAALPPRSGLVGIVRFRNLAPGEETGPGTPAYLAFVLPPGSDTPRIVFLGPADRIDREIRDWRNTISLELDANRKPSEKKCRESGEALRRSIWDPIVPLLGSVDRVFFVPDAALHQVSLATLPAKDGVYLLEAGPSFHYLSSERDLVLADRRQESRGLLAVGGPDFDAVPLSSGVAGESPYELSPAREVHYRGDRSRCRAFEAVHFEPLPGSRREIEEIASLWPGSAASVTPDDGSEEVVRLVGANAAEDAVKSLASGRRVLHIATHGFFLSGECSQPAVNTRGIGSLVAERPPGSERTNPLVLSGLALAGANRRSEAAVGEEDGILTAEEIATLDLQGVEWAVLSGCDTGAGEFQAGEGVFGLRRAFAVAGARTLIMSLWPIEDGAAREWMRGLYRARFRDHLDTPEAMRRASQGILDGRRQRGESTHPCYWGGFVAAGDWR